MNTERSSQARKEKIKNDELQLRSIFPEEVWNMIPEQDTEAAEKLSNSSLYLRSLWLSQRTLFLFPKVLQILAGQNGKKGFWSDSDFKSIKGYNLPPSPYMKRTAYPGPLNIRLVCKSWNKTFDTCCRLLNHDTSEEHERNRLVPEVREMLNYDFSSYKFALYGRDTAAKLLRHFESTHGTGKRSRSPFVGNSVRVLYVGSDQRHPDPVFFERIAELTLKYGHHVRDLSLVEEVNVFYLKGYNKLRTILEATPQLESLDIEHYLHTQKKHTFHPNPGPQGNRQLTEFMELNPLPKLKRLQCIRLAGNGSVPTIFRELVCKYNHISKLKISEISIAEYDVLATPLPNLKELSLVLYTEKDLLALKDARLNWPLTKLGLSFGPPVAFDCVNWSTVFIVVENKWSETLTEFSLVFPRLGQKCIYNNVFQAAVSASLQLKHVKRLELKFCFYLSLDFILPLKDTLEYVSVVDLSALKEFRGMGVTGESVEREANIKFWIWTENLLKSNVWMHFPKLRSVKLFRPMTMSQSAPMTALVHRERIIRGTSK